MVGQGAGSTLTKVASSYRTGGTSSSLTDATFSEISSGGAGANTGDSASAACASPVYI
jgi:hypothetical protein